MAVRADTRGRAERVKGLDNVKMWQSEQTLGGVGKELKDWTM